MIPKPKLGTAFSAFEDFSRPLTEPAPVVETDDIPSECHCKNAPRLDDIPYCINHAQDVMYELDRKAVALYRQMEVLRARSEKIQRAIHVHREGITKIAPGVSAHDSMSKKKADALQAIIDKALSA